MKDEVLRILFSERTEWQSCIIDSSNEVFPRRLFNRNELTYSYGALTIPLTFGLFICDPKKINAITLYSLSKEEIQRILDEEDKSDDNTDSG